MEELRQLHNQHLLRSLREVSDPEYPEITLAGKKVLNFSSNDYLGLAQHPALIDAAKAALDQYGTGSTGSRLVCGSLAIHHGLEETLAEAKHTEAALSFANGYSTAMGSIPAIVGKGDTIILDKLSHACLIDAAKLSEARLRVFPHNDLSALEKRLRSVREKSKDRILIITESVFSMDGDLAPLKEICRLKDQYGALLFVDEAHAVGIFGTNGQGLIEELNLQKNVEFQMGTLGKALGSAGGYLATSREWADLMINKARSFIYSTAPPPAQAAASLAALRLIRSPEGTALRNTLSDSLSLFQAKTPIIPIIIGDNEATLTLSKKLLKAGYFVPAIRYPTVPHGTARLRITLSAAHPVEKIKALKIALTHNHH